MGFVINKKKSNLIPDSKCKFLGFILNSVDMCIELPDTKRHQIWNFLKELRLKKNCKIREFASLVGCIVEACPAIQYGCPIQTAQLFAMYSKRILDKNSNRIL